MAVAQTGLFLPATFPFFFFSKKEKSVLPYLDTELLYTVFIPPRDYEFLHDAFQEWTRRAVYFSQEIIPR